MSWIEKTQPSPFDTIPIPGFFMLDGDFLFSLTQDRQFHGMTRPMIAFPSRSNRALWPSRNPDHIAEFYLFGEMGLPVRAPTKDAFGQAARMAADYGYGAARTDEHEFEVWDAEDRDHFRVSYDPETGFVANAVSMLTAHHRTFLEP